MKTTIAVDAHSSLADSTHKTLMMAAAIIGLLLFLAVVRLLRLRYLHPGSETPPRR